MKKYILGVFLLFLLSCCQSNSDKQANRFKMVLLSDVIANDTFAIISQKEICSINWEKQIYKIQDNIAARIDSMPYLLVTPGFCISFQFDGKELHKVYLFSRYAACRPNKEELQILVKERFIFNEGTLTIPNFDKKKVKNKKLFKKAEKYLREQGLLIDE